MLERRKRRRRDKKKKQKQSRKNYIKKIQVQIYNKYQKAKIKNLEQSLEFQKYNVKKKRRRKRKREKKANKNKVSKIMKKIQVQN